MEQNYLMINQMSNIVENVCVWDGNNETWTPPPNYLMLIQSTTIALLWQLNEEKTDWILIPFEGAADIGFTWNGTECVTNQPKPNLPDASTQVATLP